MMETATHAESAMPSYALVLVTRATSPVPTATGLAQLFPGVVLCGAIGLLAQRATSFLPLGSAAVSALTLALVFGVVVGNVAPRSVDGLSLGVGFSKKHLLRIAIVLYGFRLTLQDFQTAGWPVLLVDASVLVSTFALAVWVGVKLLKLDFETAVLVGAGSSICGASAVLAAAPAVGANSAQTCTAVGTVAVFGTAAFLVYPLLHQFISSQWPGVVHDHAYGVYIGSTVHDVAQVIATASASGPMTEGSAVVAKMGRVALLAPFLMALAFWTRRRTARPACQASLKTPIPWFAVLFVVAVVFNSFAPVAGLRPALLTVDGWLLVASMAALGLTTRVQAIKAAGPRPLILAGALFVWLVVGGALINVGASLLADPPPQRMPS